MDGRFYRSGITVWSCFQQCFPAFSYQKKPYGLHKNPLLCSMCFHLNWMLMNSVYYMKEDLVTILFHTVKMPLFEYFFVQTMICTTAAFSGTYVYFSPLLWPTISISKFRLFCNHWLTISTICCYF